jgi:C1A family cysteine protease
MALNYDDLRVALAQNNAPWEAAPTPVSQLDDERKRRLLGAIPSAEVLLEMTLAAPQAPPPSFAPAVDWRNHNGNHVSSVKDQGGCGSCVSFSCVAVTESMGHIERGMWADLSEADSHFCSNHGPSCAGWWPDQCLNEYQARGVSDEACFPYATAFPNQDPWQTPPTCQPCADRSARAVRITTVVRLQTPTAVKNHLSSVGPVAGCLDVFEDFFAYSNGIYHHVSGQLAGGHCVQVIGYSEQEQCWIIKNSWNTTWGMSGFGKIAYTDLLFNGAFFPMYGLVGVQFPAGVTSASQNREVTS